MTTYTVKRSSPWGPWSSLFNELGFDMRPSVRGPGVGFQESRGVYPPVNLRETDEGYVLTAEIPGVSPENVDVSIEGSTVTLSGEREIDYVVGEGTSIHRRERQTGSFRRGFELPSEIDLDAAKASHKNGVLTLSLPKSPATKPRQIQIETR